MQQDPSSDVAGAVRSIAIIMDGNGRWARRRGLPVADGPPRRHAALRRTVEAAIDLGVESLAVYAFSTENWTRPPDEVDALMEIFGETIERELPDLARRACARASSAGATARPRRCGEQMAALEDETAGNDRLQLWIAFDYGGRAELVDAARRLVEDGVPSGEIDEAALAARLYAPELPDPDLLIRTSGELRVSNFLLWQLGVRGAAVRRHAVARLRRGRSSASALAEYAQPAPAVRRPMSPARLARSSSRSSALPLVLGAVWLGGWWLFALAVVAALVALHELLRDDPAAASARARRLRGRRARAARRAARAASSGCSAGSLGDARRSPSCSRASRRRGSRRR